MIDPITTLATVPAIVALVNLAKRLGVPERIALVLALALGVALNVADHYLSGHGGYQAAVSGAILGLAASGIYDLAPSSEPRRAVEDH